MLAVNDHEFVVHDGVITIPSDRHFMVGKKGCRCVPAAIAFGVHHHAHGHSALVRCQQRFGYGLAGEGVSGDQYFSFGGYDSFQDKLEGLAIRRESHFGARVCFGVRFRRPCREAQQEKRQSRQVERNPVRIVRMYGVILLRHAVVAYAFKIKKSINKTISLLREIPIREIMHSCKNSREDWMATNKLAVIVGENISERRRRLGLSQKELADRLEISQDAMARMEKGRIAPKMGRLQDIADNLQCTVAYLFRTNDEATEERSAAIADILKTLPADGQEALVELVASAAKVMRRQ